MKPGDLVVYTTSKKERHIGVIIDCYDQKVGDQSYSLTDIFIHGRVIKGVYAHMNLIKLLEDSYNDAR